MKAFFGFFREVRDELKKVTWPTRDETIKMTVAVIITTVVVGIYVGSIDFALTKAIEQILK